ncbi:MAG TPA: DUF3866 family protein [Actinomycetota bacterium]|nr:DUF3866 family protein [Actinomycetota bacterium]
MASFREGKVVEVLQTTPVIRVRVESDGYELDAVGYVGMIDVPEVGHRVIVNATGIDLELGTGGVGFLLWDLDGAGRIEPGPGHIVKMRYTPWQTNVMSVEAPESEYHELFTEPRGLEGMPVVVCGLHSQFPAIAAGIKERDPGARVVLLVTDAGALPVRMSKLIGASTGRVIESTISVGNSFGGDLEAVNVFNGLIAARHVAQADVAIVAPGPGIVGTSTAFGFSTIDQGQSLDAAGALNGRPFLALRISSKDPRPRHEGVDAHSLTVLSVATHARTTVVVPELPEPDAQRVEFDLKGAGIDDRHDIRLESGREGVDYLVDLGIEPSSMGRSIREDEVPFLAAAAAGRAAVT